MAPELFTELPPAGFEQGGGFGNAIVGTLVMVGIAAVISVPIGILAAVFLAELEPDSQAWPRDPLPRQGADRLPLDPGRRLRLRGAGAGDGHLLGRRRRRRAGRADAADRGADRRGGDAMVPQQMKDAAYRHGLHPTQVIWKVVLPTALPGILTGVMLAIARAAGRVRAAAVHRAVQQLLAVELCASRPPRCRS